MEHTEGDWEITEVGYPKDKEFWITANQNVIAKIANIPTGDKQPEANARLIAATPKLHALLDAFNNDTGDWLSEELDMPAEDLIQAIHNRIGELFASIAEVEKG